MHTTEEAALRARIAQLPADGLEQQREAAAWQLAALQMRGPAGFKPGRRLAEGRVRRLRYPIVEAR